MTALTAPIPVPAYAPHLRAWLLRQDIVLAPGCRLDWADLYRAFVAWPRWTGDVPAPAPRDFGEALTYVCRRRGTRVEIAGSHIYCLDVAWGG